MKKGTIYMLPTLIGGENAQDVIPAEVIQKTIELRCFIVENIKTARRYLRKLDREFPIDDSTFFILNKKTDASEFRKFIQPALKGEDIGIMSEAGCPGVADPGAGVVAVAHSNGIHVKPLVGPSSILLALMGSGFSGQEFAFHGYLPKDRKDRIRKLRDFEADTRRTGMTHLFMDTPFRNMNVLEDLLNELNDATMLSIASNITVGDENIQTMSVVDWREKAYDLSKKPTIFSIGRIQ
ncbi:MAG: SAM-dependent methyltransferase [Fluviicola sp. XM-24bin1]|nr:MAG: SAM-dependent methyltransferase [Fluviicola sp. XM-24bin1]